MWLGQAVLALTVAACAQPRPLRLAPGADRPHGPAMTSRLTLDRFIPYRLSIASNLVSDRIARAYQSLFGLTIPEWRLIAVLAEQPTITPMALGERTRMDKVTVSRAAAALEKRRLIARTPHASDGRSHYLDLTAAGRDLYARVAPEALALEGELLAGWTPGEIATLDAMLRRLEAAALESGSAGGAGMLGAAPR